MSDDFNYEDPDLGGSADSWDSEGSDGFRVDFSEQEASSEARENVIIPAGWYRVAITEVTLEEVKAGNNAGKPMFNVQMTIQGGDHKGKKFYDRWCLWSGALYSVSQAMKAVGLPVNAGALNIPPAGWWNGKQMLLQVGIGNKMRKNEDTGKYDLPDLDEKNKPIKENKTRGYKAVPADWKDKTTDKATAGAGVAKVENNLAP